MPQNFDFWVSRKLNDNHRDWLYNEANWLEDYARSKAHPHRQLIVDAVKELKAGSVADIGSSCGPSLARIKEQTSIPEKYMAAIDANMNAVAFGKGQMPGVDFLQGNLTNLPWADKTYDVLLYDASLMYIPPDEIMQALKEGVRVAIKGLIIVDRFSKSRLGRTMAGGYIWGRDYPTLLKELGYKVKAIKITAKTWPNSFGWRKYGWVWIATI